MADLQQPVFLEDPVNSNGQTRSLGEALGRVELSAVALQVDNLDGSLFRNYREKFTNVRVLQISNCDSSVIDSLPTNLTHLYVGNCESLTKLDIRNLSALVLVVVHDCPQNPTMHVAGVNPNCRFSVTKTASVEAAIEAERQFLVGKGIVYPTLDFQTLRPDIVWARRPHVAEVGDRIFPVEPVEPPARRCSLRLLNQGPN
jgi:hypothetical protein